MRSRRRWLLIGIPLFIVAVAVIGGLVWVSNPAAPLPEAQTALDSDAAVMVSRDNGWIVFQPEGVTPQTGLIFYPGGLVSPEAYAPPLRAIAAAGYLVVITPVPLNLAVLNASAAAPVIAAYPDIEHWVIAGHSLGGSMAARFAYDNPDTISGLALWAAYPEADRDMSGRDLAVTSIYGSEDGLATVEQVEGARALLPPDTVWVRIEGGNHAQFGTYGDQARDNAATISRDEQQAQVVAAMLELMARVETR
jgi:pimeloyl-ACP methyl ester carboxylesterase